MLETEIRDDPRERAADLDENCTDERTQINFVWMMAAIREGEDRRYGVVNVQPEFSAGGSVLKAAAGK